MPASRHRSRSPVIACAVIATIGTCPPVVLLSLANRSSRLEAAHLGHLHVHQHDVERLFRSTSNGFTTVRRHDDRVPALLEHRHDQLLVGRVVFGNQDTQRPRPGGAMTSVAPGGRRMLGSSGRAEHRDDRIEQFGLLDRLAQVGREAGLVRARRCPAARPADVSMISLAPGSRASSRRRARA